jgi:hypothetical protein
MSTLIAKHNNGDLTDVDLKFHGEGAYRIRKSVPVFFVVRRLGLYELFEALALQYLIRLTCRLCIGTNSAAPARP